MGDPLAHLQKLLGHASVTTTHVYLDSIGEAQELIDEAVSDLADRAADTELPELVAETGAFAS
ncbi:hypothetical protein [Rhodococcus sp. MTM3W5.2]|uniref:hypothetical protein n=1 Tax=Rhodococcus sp. MTM3W5.2 TaxID=1805827 RepID=UPI0011AE46A4|nr:hypothetical protein [Rhodococcus sp. MTM3W5.2]